jgi:hypothetical protein
MAKAELEVKPGDSRDLLNEIRSLIEDARRQTAAVVNVGLTALFWQIGNRILREVLRNERAAYGEQIVATLSRQLETEFGRGFADKNLRRMMQFAEAFPDEEIVATLSRQLSWSHPKNCCPSGNPTSGNWVLGSNGTETRLRIQATSHVESDGLRSGRNSPR